MATLYKIVNWDKHFENSRSRSVDRTSFACVPNKQDGDGYTELMEHPRGTTHYGVWMALVLAASKSKTRGVLMRDTGVPHDARSLSRMTRVPTKLFDEAIPRLIEIGWLSACDTNATFSAETDTSSDAQVSPKCRSSDAQVSPVCPERKKERKNIPTAVPSAPEADEEEGLPDDQPDGEPTQNLFAEFWEAYPRRHGRKVGKEAASALFAKLQHADKPLCVAAAKFYARSTVAKEGFAKDPERFLKRDFWRDWLDPEVLEKPSRVLTPEEFASWNPTTGCGQ